MDKYDMTDIERRAFEGGNASMRARGAHALAALVEEWVPRYADVFGGMPGFTSISRPGGEQGVLCIWPRPIDFPHAPNAPQIHVRFIEDGTVEWDHRGSTKNPIDLYMRIAQVRAACAHAEASHD